MNTKTLTSHNGPLLQITLTPWEISILRSMVQKASIPIVADCASVDTGSAGVVLRDFYKALDKLSTKQCSP